jgi:hypothetical protein
MPIGQLVIIKGQVDKDGVAIGARVVHVWPDGNLTVEDGRGGVWNLHPWEVQPLEE